MNLADDKLIVNPRDELIQEITALRQKRELIKLEARQAAKSERDKWEFSCKKDVYEWSFAALAKKYFKLELEDLKSLNSDKLKRLENLIYEEAQKKFRRLKILLSFIPVVGWMFLLSMRYENTFLISNDVPLAKFCMLHQWYQENFGSVAKAILHEVSQSNALNSKEP